MSHTTIDSTLRKEVTPMNHNITNDPRLELARQRQLQLLQEAERARLARGLAAEGAGSPAGSRRQLPQLIQRLRRDPQALPREAQ